MSKQLEMDSAVKLLEMFLIEAFEDVQAQPLFIDRGTSLFITLSGISAEQASQDMGDCATITAHVDHIRYFLDAIEDYMFKRDLSHINWRTIWDTVSVVSEEEWQTIKDNLHTSYERVKSHLSNPDVWHDSHEVSAMMGMVVHTAYHLGEIRQMLCRLE